MRYILFILILFSASLSAQEIKISEMPVATAPDADDLLIINEDNVTSSITKALLQQSVLDIADTASMLTPYITRGDTAAMLSPYATDDTTETIRVDVNANLDSLAIHLDTLQALRQSVNENTLNIAINIGRIAGLSDSVSTLWNEAFPSTSFLAPIHPISHDQSYMVHDAQSDNDYVGYVHVNETDSIFNDRSVGSYSWAIVSGNTGTAFAVGASTGLLTVADNTAITGSYSLGVEITHGTDKDTATCSIYYSTTNVFIDHGTDPAGDGTIGNPYDNYAADIGSPPASGTVYWFARGNGAALDRIHVPAHWTTDTIRYGSYGTGAKPILDQNFVSGVEGIRCGSCYEVTIGGGDCLDSVTNMARNMFVYDLEVLDADNAGVEVTYNSINVQFHRLKVTGFYDNGNYFWSRKKDAASGDHVLQEGLIQDCESIVSDDDPGETAPDQSGWKIEGSGITCRNLWGELDDVADLNTAGFRFASLGHDTLEFFRWEGGRTGFQVRGDSSHVNWAVLRNTTRIGFTIIETSLPNVENLSNTVDILVENVILDNCSSHPVAKAAVIFDNQSQVALDPVRLCKIKNIDIRNSGNKGIIIEDDTTTPHDIIIENCLIRGSAEQGIEIESNVIATIVQNCISVDNTGTDILNSASSQGTLRNTIYQTLTGTFAVTTTNYDVDSGDPFVGGGDYQSAVDAPTINAGTDVSVLSDIIGNGIASQDIGAFEFGGENYNWTDR